MCRFGGPTAQWDRAIVDRDRCGGNWVFLEPTQGVFRLWSCFVVAVLWRGTGAGHWHRSQPVKKTTPYFGPIGVGRPAAARHVEPAARGTVWKSTRLSAPDWRYRPAGAPAGAG